MRSSQTTTREGWTSMMRSESMSATGKYVLGLMLVLGLAVVRIPLAHAQTFSVVHSFNGSDGANPLAGFTIDAAGKLYGTTNSGGAYNAGTVFKVTPKGKEIVLHSFTGGKDGANPQA